MATPTRLPGTDLTLRSPQDPSPIRAHCRQPRSLTQSLAACDSPADARLTPGVLIHMVFSRSTRRARPLASFRLVTSNWRTIRMGSATVDRY